MSETLSYDDIVERRRALRIPGYATLTDVGLDGDWVTPYQMASRSPSGPVLVAYNWIDAPSVEEHRAVLEANGFQTLVLDVSEFAKASGSLSCLSLRY